MRRVIAWLRGAARRRGSGSGRSGGRRPGRARTPIVRRAAPQRGRPTSDGDSDLDVKTGGSVVRDRHPMLRACGNVPSAGYRPAERRRPPLHSADARPPGSAPLRRAPTSARRPEPALRRRARRPRPGRRDRARTASCEHGSDVTGRVQLRQGGSAATAARWLGRIGARSSLICAIGRDAPGRALVAALAADGVTVRAVRVAGERTGRIGVVVDAPGQRSFVTERGAALRLRPRGPPAGLVRGRRRPPPPGLLAARPAARRRGPRGDRPRPGRRRARHASTSPPPRRSSPGVPRRPSSSCSRAAPDLLFATADEARALLGPQARARPPRAGAGRRRQARPRRAPRSSSATAATRSGSRSRRRRSTRPTRPAPATRSTRASSPAGSRRSRRGVAPTAALQRGAVLGNRTALRHLSTPPGELALG